MSSFQDFIIIIIILLKLYYIYNKLIQIASV